MATTRSRRAKIKPEEEAVRFSAMSKDKDGFEVKYINSFKGELPKYLDLKHRHVLILIITVKSCSESLSVFPSFFVRSWSVQPLPL